MEINEKNIKKNYNTKQRTLVLNLLQQHQDEKMTAEEMLTILNKEEHIISKATIYRNLDYLVNSGIIQKIFLNDICSCYLYNSKENENSFHFCCDLCGQLTLVKSPSINRLNTKLQKEYDFTIDQSKTIFHGICNHCKITH